MARRSRTSDDTPTNRSAAAVDGVAGGLLSAAMLAGAVAGAVEQGLEREAYQAAGAHRVARAEPAGEEAAAPQPLNLAGDAAGAGPAASPGNETPAGGAAPAPSAASQPAGPASPDAIASGAAEALPDALASGETVLAPAAAEPADRASAPAAAPASTAAVAPLQAAAPGSPAEATAADPMTLPAAMPVFADTVAATLTADLSALPEAIAADLGSVLAGPTSTLADIGTTLHAQLAGLPAAGDIPSIVAAPVAEVAALTEAVTAIPATLLGADTLDAPLSPLSIALGAEAAGGPQVAVPLPAAATAVSDVTAGLDAMLPDIGGLDGGGAPAIHFAGLSYLDSPEIDGGTLGGNAGLLHGLI